MKEMMLSKLLGVDDDMQRTNPIFNKDSSNEILLPAPLLPELSNVSDVKPSNRIDTTLNVSSLSTESSPAPRMLVVVTVWGSVGMFVVYRPLLKTVGFISLGVLKYVV